MTVQDTTDLSALADLPADQRADALARAARVALDDPSLDRGPLVAAMAEFVSSGEGTPARRLAVGERLGWLGDPRLLRPADPGYWVQVDSEDGPFAIGRDLVTNAEFVEFVEAGGYENPELWSDEGRAWLAATQDPWRVRRESTDAAPFIVPNQPVVGVTWYEADAYARWRGARLPRFDERLWVVRGEQRRPYPWGSPFGDGNANTQEEVLGRPCAVGLFTRDVTPEGVRDLAGNAAEWTLDGPGNEKWIHPGAWDQPSMAAWAKARELEPADARWAGLGFRLARD